MLPLAALLALPVATPVPGAEREVVWSAPLGGSGENASLGATTGVWTPDGEHVLTAGWAKPTPGGPPVGEVRVWYSATGKHLHSFRGAARSYGHRAGHLAVSPDGKLVAVGGVARGPDDQFEFFVEVWDWAAERPRAKLGGFGAFVSGVVFSPDGKRLTAIDMCGRLAAWDVATGRQVARARASMDWTFGLAHHPKLPVLAVADWAGDVSVLDAATGNPLAKLALPPSNGELQSPTFSRDGRMLACAGLNGKAPPLTVIPLRVDDKGVVSAGTPIVTPVKVDGCMYQIAFSPDGKLIAAACQDKSVRLYDADTARLLVAATEHTDFVYSVEFSPDGRRLLSVGRDAVKVWSVAELRNRRPAP